MYVKIDQMSEYQMLNTYLILIVVIVNEAIVGVEWVFGRTCRSSTPIDTDDQQTDSNEQQHDFFNFYEFESKF